MVREKQRCWMLRATTVCHRVLAGNHPRHWDHYSVWLHVDIVYHICAWESPYFGNSSWYNGSFRTDSEIQIIERNVTALPTYFHSGFDEVSFGLIIFDFWQYIDYRLPFASIHFGTSFIIKFMKHCYFPIHTLFYLRKCVQTMFCRLLGLIWPPRLKLDRGCGGGGAHGYTWVRPNYMRTECRVSLAIQIINTNMLPWQYKVSILICRNNTPVCATAVTIEIVQMFTDSKLELLQHVQCIGEPLRFISL
jgi:hypothetical protein